jgi:hypothetical protein
MSYPSPSTSQRIAIDRAIHTLEQEASDAWGRQDAALRAAAGACALARADLLRQADTHKRHAEELRSVADELSTYFPKGDEK